nr:MAG TPA: hypothetical protein [Caudoviricetes sp.]
MFIDLGIYVISILITLPLSLAIANSSLYHNTIYMYCRGLRILTRDLGLLLVLLYIAPQ